MVGVVVGGLVLDHKTKPYHLLTVAPGVLYRSGQLDPDVLEQQIERFGIQTVVNLQSRSWQGSERHRAERAACERAGATLVDLPLEPETPPTVAQQEQWRRLLNDPARHPILVHCQHGIVRTGMLVAMYEVERGRGNAAVLNALPMFGHKRGGPKRRLFREFILAYRAPPRIREGG